MRYAVPASLALLTLLTTDSAEPQPPKKDPYAEHVAPTEPRTPEEQQKLFLLPPGFEIQLVAAEPLIGKPINIAFDAAGRLWVTVSFEYPFPAPPDRTPKDRVQILADFGPSGRARKITTFAEGLNIPIGVLPIPKGALVYSIPNIYRMTDAGEGGKAQTREPLYGQYGFRDTHGMTGEFQRGFDGWVYVCHGYSNTSTVKGKQGPAITMTSGNTYRIKLDGSRIEHFTHGQVNPFGLCFDPLGNLYSCDCHSRPIYQLLRGACYPSFGRPDDGLGFGPEMLTHDHGSTAIAGITYYAAKHFPPEFRDNIFIGNVVTNRINRDRLEKHGSSYKAIEMPDFVKCKDPWFRPVDIKLGPDGALYVADFYNRIIGHYEVPLNHPGRDRFRGRIWRIVYTGKGGQPLGSIVDYTKATPKKLAESLADDNLTVRLTATNEMVDRGGPAVLDAASAVLRQPKNAFQKLHALWVLARLKGFDDASLEACARDRDPAVRAHALRVLDWLPVLTDRRRGVVLNGLKDVDPLTRRCAAEALGSHPDAENIRPLLDLLRQVPADDTHLLHVARMALRDQLKARAAWVVVSLFDAQQDLTEGDERALADAALGVPGDAAASYLLEHVRRRGGDPVRLAREVHHIARYGDENACRSLFAFVRGKIVTNPVTQAALVKEMHKATQERGATLGPDVREYADDLTHRLIRSANAKEVHVGVELAGLLKLAGLYDRLAAMLTDTESNETQKRAAVSALAAINSPRAIPLLGRLVSDSGTLIALREQAAGAVAGMNRPEARETLIEALKTAEARLQNTIALEMSKSPQGAEKLLEAVAAGKASARLLLERGVDVNLRQRKLPNLKERLKKLTRGLPKVDERLQQVLTQRRAGFLKAKADAIAGAKVFEKNCANCHQLANQGAKIGPQLDGIGIRGLDRLLEDILDPNRNIDQAFRATTVVMKSGQVVTGLLLRQEGAVWILADAQGKEVRIPDATVDERTVSQLSPMPANFVDQVTEQEFNNLLAFLLNQRVAAGK
jgi:putative heme-binding domain-containing protein